ncbi:MAG: HAD family hydrolase [Candidatus Bathyarchaeota archaeon]|nr:HAD family hydrolase [Candidatus Bathyarchaeota archaeon]
MSRLTVKAILTDMDGTFTRFNLDYMGMRRAALKLLDEVGLMRPNFSDQLSVYVMLKELRGTISTDRFNEIKNRVYGMVEKIEAEAAGQVQLMPGAREALNELKQMKKKIVVVTNNGRLGTDRTLDRLELGGVFDGVVTRDDADQLKPDPGIVLKALDLARVKAGEAILVGDAVIDIRAARAAAVRSVAVPTGPFPAARLLQEEPDFIVSSFLEVPGLVRRLDG